MEKKKIRISDVILMVKGGYIKSEIGKKYGLNTRELKVLFEHPALKEIEFPSFRKPVSFEIVDDVNDTDINLEKCEITHYYVEEDINLEKCEITKEEVL